jgi:3-oxoacyl-[acyl-carrier protein] reductase
VRAAAFQADRPTPDAVDALSRSVRGEFRNIDILVANAALADRLELTDLDLRAWQKTLAVNLTAPFLLSQQLIPAMAERRFGRVFFTSSVAAFTGGLVGPHYAACQAGLHGLLYWPASAYAIRGATVNAIAPALIADTDMLPGGRQAAHRIPVGRFGRPEEVAQLALAMLSNAYLTCKVFLLDGGIHPH